MGADTHGEEFFGVPINEPEKIINKKGKILVIPPETQWLKHVINDAIEGVQKQNEAISKKIKKALRLRNSRRWHKIRNTKIQTLCEKKPNKRLRIRKFTPLTGLHSPKA